MIDWLTRPAIPVWSIESTKPNDVIKKHLPIEQALHSHFLTLKTKLTKYVPFYQTLARSYVDSYGEGICNAYVLYFINYVIESGVKYNNLRASLNLRSSSDLMAFQACQPDLNLLEGEEYINPPILKYMAESAFFLTMYTGCQYRSSNVCKYDAGKADVTWAKIKLIDEARNNKIQDQTPVIMSHTLLCQTDKGFIGHAMASVILEDKKELHCFDPNFGLLCFKLEDFNNEVIKKHIQYFAEFSLKLLGIKNKIDYKLFNTCLKRTSDEQAFEQIKGVLDHCFGPCAAPEKFAECANLKPYKKLYFNHYRFSGALKTLHNIFNKPANMSLNI